MKFCTYEVKATCNLSAIGHISSVTGGDRVVLENGNLAVWRLFPSTTTTSNSSRSTK